MKTDLTKLDHELFRLNKQILELDPVIKVGRTFRIGDIEPMSQSVANMVDPSFDFVDAIDQCFKTRPLFLRRRSCESFDFLFSNHFQEPKTFSYRYPHLKPMHHASTFSQHKPSNGP